MGLSKDDKCLLNTCLFKYHASPKKKLQHNRMGKHYIINALKFEEWLCFFNQCHCKILSFIKKGYLCY